MNTNSNGSVINAITAIDKSVVYQNFVAFQDEDGAVIHIRISELEKLHQFYVSTLGSQKQTTPAPDNFDAFIT